MVIWFPAPQPLASSPSLFLGRTLTLLHCCLHSNLRATDGVPGESSATRKLSINGVLGSDKQSSGWMVAPLGNCRSPPLGRAVGLPETEGSLQIDLLPRSVSKSALSGTLSRCGVYAYRGDDENSGRSANPLSWPRRQPADRPGPLSVQRRQPLPHLRQAGSARHHGRW